MEHIVHPAAAPLSGVVRVPGDKSVSHRAVLLAAMAQGTSRLNGLLDSDDVGSTISAVTALGAGIERDGESVVVTGWGERGPSEPPGPIDCGNSGTTARLLAGIVAGWPIEVTLEGDESLSSRPMERVAAPLRKMGAEVETTEGTLPMTIRGGELQGITYDSPVPSAQVKTLVLLAGLRAEGRTSVTERAASRSHTERMLPAFGVYVRPGHALEVSVVGPAVPVACDVDIPGDPSSATFFAVAGAIVPGSTVTVSGLLLNPTRTAALDVLGRIGVPISRDHTGSAAGEDVGDVTVAHAEHLQATSVRAREVPSLIDEVPVLAVAATQAEGVSLFEAVGELRVKESDRLGAIVADLKELGANVRSGEDWLEVEGPCSLGGWATLDSRGDHRLAMAYHVAALVAESPLRVVDYDAVSVSYPDFAKDMASLGGGVE